jgi:tetratricopeptide (TPR) repeat protein
MTLSLNNKAYNQINKSTNMKQLSILLLGLMISAAAIAQPSKRTSAWTYLNDRQYGKAVEAINQAAQHETTINDPKTWHFRAMIYHDIAISQDSAVLALSKDPLTESLNSIKKCSEYDVKKKFTNKNMLILKDLALFFFNTGIDKYNTGVQQINKDEEVMKTNFTKALGRFEQYFEAVQLMGKDSMYVTYELAKYKINYQDIYQYAATSADQIGKKARAKSLYRGLVDVKYDGSLTYINLADIYLDEDNTEEALKVIDAGKENVKDKDKAKDLTIKELQIYQKAGKLDELILKLENALAADPTNPNLAITLAESYFTISEKLAEEEKPEDADKFRAKAIETFNSSLSLLKEDDNELRFLINNKIGTIYFNKGVDIYNASLNLRDAAKEEEAKAQYMAEFEKAIPYLEKSMELRPDDKTAIPLLINIYLRKGDMEKVGELNKLKNK